MTNSYPPKRPEWSNSKFVNRPKEKLWLDRNECRNHKTISLIEQLSLASVNEHICSKYLDLGFLYNSLYSAYQIKESKVCFTNGADGAIRIFYEFLMTSGNNHNCYLMRPSYGMYEVYSRNYCKNTEFIDYEPFVNGNSNVFNILIKTLESAPSKSSFILANPESPTGLEFDNHQIEKIISVCERKGIYFLLDETYKSFGSRPSPLFIDEIISPFLFQVISFSKSWGLSGFRIGCLNSNESNMRLIKRTRPMYEIGSFQATLMAKCFDNRFLLEKEFSFINRHFWGKIKKI